MSSKRARSPAHLSSKKKASDAAIESAKPRSDITIKVYSVEETKHFLNWTKLIAIAPKTCFYRAFNTDGETVRTKQFYSYPGWFMNALCSYVDACASGKEEKFTVEPLYANDAARIFYDLLYIDCEGEISVDDWMADALAFINPEWRDRAIEKLEGLKEKAAKIALGLVESVPDECPHSIVAIDMVHAELSTNVSNFQYANNVRRLYYIVKLLGPYAFNGGLFPYAVTSKVYSHACKVELRIYHVETSNSGPGVKFQMLLRQYEI